MSRLGRKTRSVQFAWSGGAQERAEKLERCTGLSRSSLFQEQWDATEGFESGRDMVRI